MAVPKCFINYSWDDADHKSWVRRLALDLQNNGVQVFLDQWDASPGIDAPEYMGTSIRESDFTLIVCTPNFCKKANSGIGGVGYETRIVTGEIFTEIALPTKFVPILRKGSPEESLPSYLKSKFYIDFRNNDEYDQRLEELLRHIHNFPKFLRPPLGSKPDLKPVENMKKDSPSKKSDKNRFTIFKEVFEYAKRWMGKGDYFAEEFASKWLDNYAEKDFAVFKEAFYFATTTMSKSQFLAEEFTIKWMDNYYNVNFNNFKNAFIYATTKMSKGSWSAEEFAFKRVESLLSGS